MKRNSTRCRWTFIRRNTLKNIKDLEILNTILPETLKKSFDEIRPNYVSLNKSIEDLEDEILTHPEILAKI